MRPRIGQAAFDNPVKFLVSLPLKVNTQPLPGSVLFSEGWDRKAMPHISVTFTELCNWQELQQ